MSEPNPADGATRKSSPPRAPETLPHDQTQPGSSAGAPGRGPMRFGRFVVRRLLGEGAFARVYLAFDPELEREVAIKVPKAEELTPEFRDTFLRENRSAASIHHPNICPIFEVGTDGGVPYIVMRMVPDTLAGLLRRSGKPMSPRNAAILVRKLALGLAAVHAKGVIHRDLKPANVLYSGEEGEVLIADFGLARLANRASDASMGVPKGTPAYMAPEQARGQADAVGTHSDLYALGVILFELVVGRAPFGGSVYEVMHHHCETPPAPPSSLRPGLDPKIDAVVLKAMAKEPSDRYASARALADALGDYVRATEPKSGSGPASPSKPEPPRPPHPPRARPVRGPRKPKEGARGERDLKSLLRSPVAIAVAATAAVFALAILIGIAAGLYSAFGSRPADPGDYYEKTPYRQAGDRPPYEAPAKQGEKSYK
jgi:serine/threonine protein kinase